MEPSADPREPVRLVFLLHGILLNRWFFAPMASFLTSKGFRVVNRSYSTTRHLIEEHAEEAARRVEEVTAPLRAEGIPHEVNFVTHSLGGLVVRYLLTHHGVDRVRRCVLLAPPNNGSVKARLWRESLFYRLVYGRRAGAQLATEPPGIFARCGVPRGVELGILAGVVRGAFLTVPSRSLPCPHDGVVTLEEAALPGVPLKQLPYGHTSILWRKNTMKEVAHFLEHGSFLPEPSVAREVAEA